MVGRRPTWLYWRGSAGRGSVVKPIIPLLLVAAATSLAPGQEPVEPERTIELDARPAPSTPLPDLPNPADYRIGRQDLLEIRVFDVEELDQVVRVGDDGSITMPLLGRLVVDGLTRTELEATIAGLLEARFVRDPQVSVFVKEYESKKVAVTGSVKNPGSYEMLGRKTLLEMISLAGGLDREIGREIVIFRQTDGVPTRRIPIDLERLVYDADPGLNVSIEPGDIIYVPTVEKVRIFVSGAVKNPNLYEVPRNQPVTVLKAITLAGGTTDRAAEKRVQIIRTDDDGGRSTLEVNLQAIKRGKVEDPILQPDDLVLVPEGFF
jgi:polysaccharide export outer membrane protein